MYQLQVALVVAYLLMVRCFFTNWLKVLKKDTSLSSKERLGSLMFLVIISILWPVVVPFAYLELLNKKNNALDKEEFSSEEPVLIMNCVHCSAPRSLTYGSAYTILNSTTVLR